MTKVRLDKVLVDKGYCATIEKAIRIIRAGNVLVNGERLDKPGKLVFPENKIVILGQEKYVSRGGIKLEKALNEFKVNVENKIIVDIGASTGGFTDCLLQRGAKKVYCVDVGYGQLDWKLRNDPRVAVKEKTNARYLKKSDFDDEIDLAVIDVSFISLKKVIPTVLEIIKHKGEIIALIKPQFEVSPEKISRGGVIKEESYRLEAIEDIIRFAKSLNLNNKGVIPSPIKGPAGNIEYFCYLSII